MKSKEIYKLRDRNFFNYKKNPKHEKEKMMKMSFFFLLSCLDPNTLMWNCVSVWMFFVFFLIIT